MIINVKENIEYLSEAMDMIYEEWGRFFNSSREEKFVKIKSAIQSGEEFPQVYVLKDQDKIIGSFTFKEKDIDGEEYETLSPWLSCVVIKKEYRGMGYGRKILQYIDKIAKQNYKQLYLFTTLTGYYEKIGFEFIKEIVHNGELNRLYKKVY